MNNVFLKIEQVEYEKNLSSEFLNELILNRICTITTDNKVVFKASGFVVYKNDVYIIFPKNYIKFHNEKHNNEYIKVLFKTLMKYKNEKILDPFESELLGGSIGNKNENITTAFMLINDFVTNGLLIKEITRRTTAYGGNIDWGNTVNKKDPIISGKNIIYHDKLIRKKTLDSTNLLIQLQKFCLYKSIEKYGWLFDFEIDKNLFEISELNFEISFAINFLEQQLNSTYVERDIFVINLIKDFLIGIQHQQIEEKIETLMTPYFHNVWESICSNIFGNQYNSLKQIVPRLKWGLDNNAIVQPQRPDIMLIKNKELYILDAKYYDVYKNLPGWKDIVKQFYYAETIRNHINSPAFLKNRVDTQKINNIKNIRNIFLFPSNEDKPIIYIGNVTIENNSSLGVIKSYKINTFYAMKIYIGEEANKLFVENLL
ncbi:LlaJI family restriction endonuclease [Virgibacillus sp. YIM 98842]|uniref:LlaJI family restriction endonuclease n=1 Tax=Virgibacillus sp. YIM 98842 TaxID=2663533 RepID=UPI0013DD41B2|nr:LlaJI family restriction endonuclease [Virgibacillus sp. YIM 98842]